VVGAGFSSNRGRADELRESIETDGGTLTLHQGNVGEWDDCQRVVQEVIDQHGRLDILVNNGASPSTARSGRCPSTIGTRCCG
jgi:NAD(P)-dependent dehydrogenase (short-subunit alcohol dehydrogenase family)